MDLLPRITDSSHHQSHPTAATLGLQEPNSSHLGAMRQRCRFLFHLLAQALPADAIQQVSSYGIVRQGLQEEVPSLPRRESHDQKSFKG